ncbi:hypothetical protein Tco_1092103 [Tanacetum coccineum]|uniref:Uncharacterized protein n=1 Tax=Tanacetum coccineum TaxID=301880 RepID=A0ABQ5IA88_9ASTR
MDDLAFHPILSVDLSSLPSATLSGHHIVCDTLYSKVAFSIAVNKLDRFVSRVIDIGQNWRKMINRSINEWLNSSHSKRLFTSEHDPLSNMRTLIPDLQRVYMTRNMVQRVG